MTSSREAIEQPIRDAHARGDYERGTTLALETYGREILGFLISRLGESGGHDVLSDFMEDFWRGFPAFAWRSSLRTWAYTLAHHAVARYVRSPHHGRARAATSSAVSEVVERVRTETAAHLKTEIKDRFRELRSQLPEDDQTLLILRVDRNLPWRELALVMAEPKAALSEAELDSESAKLRTRFKRAKERLRQLAEAEGLLPRDDGEASKQ
jgi:RNA polymerase sigma-70 factor, ECF subfamily